MELLSVACFMQYFNDEVLRGLYNIYIPESK